ncbi:hypothetical protein HOY80DRAFT_883834, partial [Tuber brumale]
GYAPCLACIREMAQRMMHSRGRSVVIRRSWVPRFSLRHPHVTTAFGKPINPNSIRGTKPELMRSNARVHIVHVRNGIQEEYIWNFD